MEWKHRNTTWKLEGQDLTHTTPHGECTYPIGMKLKKAIENEATKTIFRKLAT